MPEVFTASEEKGRENDDHIIIKNACRVRMILRLSLVHRTLQALFHRMIYIDLGINLFLL